MSIYENRRKVNYMRFGFVFIAFYSLFPPPLANTLNSKSRNHKFAPLSSHGQIYTADVGLWKSCANSGLGDDIQAPCPRHSNIIESIKFSEHNNCYFIVALSDFSKYFPPGALEEYLLLEPWAQFEKVLPSSLFVDVGYDVIDYWTNISALVNFGYQAKEVEQLESMELQSNKFGLLSTMCDVKKFIDFSSKVATEHTPFIPVKVLARIPRG